MKTHYTIIRMFLVLALTANSIVSRAQNTVEYLTANNVNAGFGVGGNLFTMLTDSISTTQFGLFEVPKGSDLRTLFTTGLWLSARDAGSNLLCAAQRYNQDGPDFHDGPVAANYDSLYDNFYKRVFKITRSQIVSHQSLGNVIIPTQIDTAVLFWPAKGNAYVANYYGVTISSHLAPYVDVNNNGYYDPNHGDYPAICGEEAVFFVFNDVRGPHLETGGIALGAEIRGLAEAFLDTSFGSFNSPVPEKRPINNTVFVSYEIENKSANNLFNLHVGLFEDPDLGCYMNDRVGCDTNRNLMFVYNDGTDVDCNGITGYKAFKVANGTKFLNKEQSVFGYFTNGAIAGQNDPGNSVQIRSYMLGYWADGTPFTEGGTGYGGTTPIQYLLPGDPNNLSDWTDMTSGYTASDRRMFGSSAQGMFTAGETKFFDFAFTTSYDSTATFLTIVDTLKRDADEMQSFYNSHILACRNQQTVGLSSIAKDELQILIYPNPATTQLNIQIDEPLVDTKLNIYDVTGALIQTCALAIRNSQFEIQNLSTGVYIAEIKTKEASVKRRWVKM